jgi:hypothetical protein
MNETKNKWSFLEIKSKEVEKRRRVRKRAIHTQRKRES